MWPQNANAKRGQGEHPVDKDNHGMDTMRYSVAFWDSLAIEPMRADTTEPMGQRVVISRF